MLASGPGEVLVMLHNRRQLEPGQAARSSGGEGVVRVSSDGGQFITDAGLEETTAAVRTLLMEQGWEPYGSAGDVMYFKQNAVKLHARVLSPQAEPGKTVIDYSCEQLSADLASPAGCGAG